MDVMVGRWHNFWWVFRSVHLLAHIQEDSFLSAEWARDSLTKSLMLL
nr:hypothetical protein Iba_chr05dCG0110 [Ipomoea batatas]